METIIDIAHIPFSCYGGMLSVSKTPDKNELIIHDVRQRFNQGPVFGLYIVPEDFACDSVTVEKTVDGLPFDVQATPSRVEITAEGGTAQIRFMGDHRLHIHSEGLSLLLIARTGYGYGIMKDARHYEMIYVTERRYGLVECPRGIMTAAGPYIEDRTLRGVHPFDARQNVMATPVDGVIDLEVEVGQTEVRQDPVRSVEENTAIIEKDWMDFLAQMPPVPEQHQHFAQVTWYNLWSSYVRAQDVYKTDVMLMSKKHMSSVWTWDHCFNALSVAYADCQKALDQFFVPFWKQNESGVLLDMFNPGMEIVWGVTKPPVHGWCFSKIMDRYNLDEETLRTAYGFLEKWTAWWMNYRDEDGDGIPAYPQGCDSGWDNATIFTTYGRFIESADLSAFLVLQMRCLARIADKLGDAENRDAWTKQSQDLLDRMIRHFWNGKAMVPTTSGSHTPIENTGCLLNYMPLVLGDLLPKEIADVLVENMMKHNLTQYGLATEAPDSDMYEYNGYWRGPIWAPSTYLIVDGLNRMGKTEEAKIIAKRFTDMCAFAAKGNYENFDPLTGKGLCAPGYTWTASVYLCLLWEYCM